MSVYFFRCDGSTVVLTTPGECAYECIQCPKETKPYGWLCAKGTPIRRRYVDSKRFLKEFRVT